MKEVASQNQNEDNIFIVDIPGQIEVFTWSSSSLILTAAISSLMPVKIVYIIDSVRCRNPNVFLSNILFARINNSKIESIQYRFNKYPFTILLNKSDCSDTNTLKLWIEDYEAFMAALH